MVEHSRHIQARPGSDRGFGLVFAGVFAVVALYPLLGGGGLIWPAAGGAVALAAAALAWPRVFTGANRLWFRFGMLLGHIISPAVMALVYVVAVVPTGLAMRMAGKDPLRTAKDESATTYWIERDWPMQSMEHQF